MQKLIAEIKKLIAEETEPRRLEAYRHVLTLLQRQSDGLQTFFYLLLRDHLVASDVEKLVDDASASIGKTTRYSNEFLAGYASELRARILGDMK